MLSWEVSRISLMGEVSLACGVRLGGDARSLQSCSIMPCREVSSDDSKLKADNGEEESGTLHMLFTRFRKGFGDDGNEMGEEGGLV